MAVYSHQTLDPVLYPAGLELQTNQSAVAWSAIWAGAVVAIGVTLILMPLGSGFGLTQASAWPGAGPSPKEFTIGAGIWLIVMQWISSLFGGYMFVGLNDGQTPGDLPDIDGVHAVVRFSTERDPVSVPFRPVSAILGAEMGGLFDRTVVVARPQPRPGDVVQITGGKFTGFAAQVVRLEKDKRIRLLFEIFGRASEMTEKLANVALLS